ncbi:MAG: hypothetical protein PHZ00_04985 [Candidatus Peribacteraceae bacterium]|nr:hypothetical protein [Candidatus Peribacteraceae bacterium]
MKRLFLPILISIVAVAIIAGISYQAIVNQRSALPDADTASSSDESSSSTSDVLATSNVSYSGTVEETALVGSPSSQSAYKLTLSDGSYVLLESTDANLVLASYLGKRVEILGTVRPSGEAGILLLRVEEVTMLDTPVSLSSSSPQPQFCGGIAAFPCPTGFDCVDDPTDSCDPASGGADCGGICIAATGSTAATDSSSTAATTSSSAAPTPPPPPSTSSSSSLRSSSSSVSAAVDSSASASSVDTSALDQQIVTMTKQNYDASQWTQQYCTSHLAFCIPAHKNWYYKSFGATTSNVWHVEFGIAAIDELNQGAIILNLVPGSSASMNAESGQIKTQGSDVIGFLDWNDDQHFELIADARLRDVIAYMLTKITPYTPPVQ